MSELRKPEGRIQDGSVGGVFELREMSQICGQGREGEDSRQREVVWQLRVTLGRSCRVRVAVSPPVGCCVWTAVCGPVLVQPVSATVSVKNQNRWLAGWLAGRDSVWRRGEWE